MALPSKVSEAQPVKSRVLILLDASGSMRGQWEGERKFDLARRKLFHVVDSINNASPSTEFALRLFGHQHYRDEENCLDTRLEVSFRQNNANSINTAILNAKPQGQTPIAYSLSQAAYDFPKDYEFQNAIILITDGIETCDGDPCNSARTLVDNRITLKPYVIGLGLEQDQKSLFNCVGPYFDVVDEKSFDVAFKEIIQEAILPEQKPIITQTPKLTTLQVNLNKEKEGEQESNVPFTLYDQNTSEAVYQFVHAINSNGLVDTLEVDANKTYDLVVHTIPPIKKEAIKLDAHKHNIVSVPASQGNLFIRFYGPEKLVCLIRKKGESKTIHVQDVNSPQRYLTGEYEVEVLSLPKKLFTDVSITEDGTTELVVRNSGELTLNLSEPKIVSIYEKIDGKLKMIYEARNLSEKTKLRLLEGEYILVQRGNIEPQSIVTKMQKIIIRPKGTLNLNL